MILPNKPKGNIGSVGWPPPVFLICKITCRFKQPLFCCIAEVLIALIGLRVTKLDYISEIIKSTLASHALCFFIYFSQGYHVQHSCGPAAFSTPWSDKCLLLISTKCTCKFTFFFVSSEAKWCQYGKCLLFLSVLQLC